MTKLIAIITLTTGFGLAACKTEPDKTKETAPFAKPTEETKPAPAPAPTPTVAAELPAECTEYKAAMEKIATCDKVPQQQRDALKQAYDTSATAWTSIPADGKAALATSCKNATDAVKASAAACP